MLSFIRECIHFLESQILDNNDDDDQEEKEWTITMNTMKIIMIPTVVLILAVVET